MEGELRCLEKNKRYPGAKAGAHCKLAPSSKRHRGRSFADQSELNTIANIYHLVGFERILSGIAKDTFVGTPTSMLLDIGNEQHR